MPTHRTKRTRRPRTQQSTILGAVIVACILAIGYLISEGIIDRSRFGINVNSANQPASPVVSSTGSDEAIKVFFTTPSLIYPDVPKKRTPPPYEQALIADIDAATSSIEMVTFEYNLSSIAQALVRAKARGVEVRLALDRENLDDPVMAKWAGSVQDAEIPVSWQESDAFLHSKFVIIDSRLVWTGSWNTTINDTYRNNNNLLRISIPAIVANYQAEFAQMAAGNFSTSKSAQTPNPLVRLANGQVENYFSPQDHVREQIVSRIEQASQSVEFMAFSFTSDQIGAAMIARQAAGVPVRGVFERRNAEGSGSEYQQLRKGKVAVRIDGNCYTMHHKVIIIDGRIVITGSYNFTGRAEDLNDENLLIIDNPDIAALYIEEFERVYQQAQNPQACG